MAPHGRKMVQPSASTATVKRPRMVLPAAVLLLLMLRMLRAAVVRRQPKSRLRQSRECTARPPSIVWREQTFALVHETAALLPPSMWG